MAATAFRPLPRDLATALGLLTRLPLPVGAFNGDDARPAAYAAWAYPMMGVVVGGIAAGVAWISLAVGMPPAIAALIAVLGSALVTGAMHEDGLADCADGFWGGWTRERRLSIMQDSQIGTYGVIALFSALGLRVIAIAAIASAGQLAAVLVGAAIISRAAMVWVMYALPHARQSGLSRQTGRPPFAAASMALAIGVFAALLVTPAPFFAVVVGVAVVTFAIQSLAKYKIGGQTGDVLGATQQVTEIVVVLTCLAVLP